MLTTKAFKLFEIETGRALADSLKVKPLLGLSISKELVIPVAPTQTRQVVAHARSRIAHHLIFFGTSRAVAF